MAVRRVPDARAQERVGRAAPDDRRGPRPSRRRTTRARSGSTRCAVSTSPSQRARWSRSWGRAAAARRRCSTASPASTQSTRGEVLIEGTPLSHMSDRERTDYRARRMGFVFQFYNLMPVLTRGRERRAAAAARAGGRGKARGGRSTHWRSSGSPSARATCRTSSPAGSGSASRSRARSSTTRRSSGPTSRPATSTPRTPTEIIELMRRLNVERGLTFLIVTHDIAVGRKTDRIVRMVDGEIAAKNCWG